jgi:hypothetical protein
VPKQHVLDKINGPSNEGNQGSPTDRMLAAIIPHGQEAWFFKVTGPLDALGEKEEEFRAFIQSVHFADGTPQWTVPEGWRQQAGSEMRYATLRMGEGEPPLELTVSKLPWDEESGEQYKLANVNRWRGQMQLAPLRLNQLADETEQLQLEGATATLVDLQGRLGETGMSRPPFAGQLPPTRPSRPEPEAAAPVELKYDVPQGWAKAPNDSFSQAAFEVVEGDQKVRITVSPLAAAAGALLPNVNRWRGQVGLPPTAEEQLKQESRPIEVGQSTGTYVELVGPESAAQRQTILGAIVPAGRQSWFFKLVGDSQLAAREKERFEAFLKSVQFSGAEGAGDGQ